MRVVSRRDIVVKLYWKPHAMMLSLDGKLGLELGTETLS